jgi:hypothetical protein
MVSPGGRRTFISRDSRDRHFLATERSLSHQVPCRCGGSISLPVILADRGASTSQAALAMSVVGLSLMQVRFALAWRQGLKEMRWAAGCPNTLGCESFGNLHGLNYFAFTVATGLGPSLLQAIKRTPCTAFRPSIVSPLPIYQNSFRLTLRAGLREKCSAMNTEKRISQKLLNRSHPNGMGLLVASTFRG